MTRDKYVGYGVAIAAGAVFAVWVGLPPTLLLFLLVCPLMMFFMMRGMHGGGGHNPGQDRTEDGKTPDGSHERIDHPKPF